MAILGEERFEAYIDGCDPAVSGQGGSVKTLMVAEKMVVGFGLSDSLAMKYLRRYNERCRPLWTEKELLHKVQSAKKNPKGRVRGYLLADSANKLVLPSNRGFGEVHGVGVSKGIRLEVEAPRNIDTLKSLIEKKIKGGDEKDKDMFFYRSQSDLSKARSNPGEGNAMDFRKSIEMQMERVPKGYDPEAWVKRGKAIPTKNKQMS
jgi:hypothetical protein